MVVGDVVECVMSAKASVERVEGRMAGGEVCKSFRAKEPEWSGRKT